MKTAVRTISLAIAFAIILSLGLTAVIRLAPVTLSDWHQPLASAGQTASSDCTLAIRPGRGSSSATCLLPGLAADVLVRLDAAALATARTRLIAGSPAEGLMTWETRSAVWGFPDYTTAQATQTPQGTRLDLFARLRFGGYDFGVNGARLARWIDRLQAG